MRELSPTEEAGLIEHREREKTSETRGRRHTVVMSNVRGRNFLSPGETLIQLAELGFLGRLKKNSKQLLLIVEAGACGTPRHFFLKMRLDRK